MSYPGANDLVDKHGRPVETYEDHFSNLSKGRRISNRITELLQLQKNLKNAFYHMALDGGPVAAENHPLYIEATEEIRRLQNELVFLI